MKICFIGDFSEDFDEGYKNTGHFLSREVEEKHEVARLNIRKISDPLFWKQALSVKPQIIHTIAQPTNASFIFGRIVKIRTGARSVLSALKSDRYFATNRSLLIRQTILRLAKPDLILVQDSQAEMLFKQAGCRVAYLPNGVDWARYRPASSEQKALLREKYGIPHDKPVVLHVGHLRDERNLFALEPLVKAGIEVIIVGSLYIGTNESLINRLKGVGFRIYAGYQPQVEEFYMLSDGYVFPPKPGDSLSMPLSVLEAMACNLPIVTTRFPGLVQVFKENSSFRFVDDGSQILACTQSVLKDSKMPATRDLVMPYSWQAVTERLIGYYEGLLIS